MSLSDDIIITVTRSTVATLRRHAEMPQIAKMTGREALLLEAETMEAALEVLLQKWTGAES